jgi:predicted ATPase with chaperone activity
MEGACLEELGDEEMIQARTTNRSLRYPHRQFSKRDPQGRGGNLQPGEYPGEDRLK